MKSAGHLSRLPNELYLDILDQVPTIDLQATALALTRNLPRGSIPRSYLFHHVRLKTPEQVRKLMQHLVRARGDLELISKFSMEAWIADPDVVINLIRMMKKLKWLSLWVGSTCTPEHLAELFEKPFGEVEYISLRFRPYVQKATYYHFLKGAYYDSSLEALSNWPTQQLHSVSIIQDELDPAFAHKHQFAQPLVFFRLDPLTTLTTAPALSAARHIRLRVPARQLARFITHPAALPAAALLDLSTSALAPPDVLLVLARLRAVRHLRLDGCAGLRGIEDWAAFGRECAAAAVGPARQREKKLRAWLEAMYAHAQADTTQGEPAPVPAEPPRRGPRRGRRGLATATISLRASPPREALPLPGARVSVPAGAVPRYRVLPPCAVLRTLCLPAPAHAEHEALRAAFARGWAAGVAAVGAARGRMRTAAAGGRTRLLRWAGGSAAGEEGFAGLVEVGAEEQGEEEGGECPVVCFAGPGEGMHVERCGHRIAREVWEDRL